MRSVFKWRVTTNKYLYITDGNPVEGTYPYGRPFLFNKKESKAYYSNEESTLLPTGVDEGKIQQFVGNINNENIYRDMYNTMVDFAKHLTIDKDVQNLTLDIDYKPYFNLDNDTCVIEAVTPKCEGYEPVFDFRVHTVDDSGNTQVVPYDFYPERNEHDKTLRYVLDFEVPKGEKGDPGNDGAGCKGDKGDQGDPGPTPFFTATATASEATGDTADVTVEVTPDTSTKPRTYNLDFKFEIPAGTPGDPGNDGNDGKDDVFTGITASAERLGYDQVPYVKIYDDSSNRNVNRVKTIWNPEEIHDPDRGVDIDGRYESSFYMELGIPEGAPGIQGPDGRPSNIRIVDATVEETLEPGEQAQARAEVVRLESNNEYDIHLFFKIPRGQDGQDGTDGHDGKDTIRYNFSAEAIPSDEVESIVLDWDQRFLPTENDPTIIEETLQLYYPKIWDGGSDIKHRYNATVDSLAEGVQDAVGGMPLSKAVASGIRSHAEGIGNIQGDLVTVEAVLNGNCSSDDVLIIGGKPDESENIEGGAFTLRGSGISIDEEDRALSNDLFVLQDGSRHGFLPGVEDAIRDSTMTIVSYQAGDTETEHYSYSDIHVSFAFTYTDRNGIERTYNATNHSLKDLVDGGRHDGVDFTYPLQIIVASNNARGIATHTEGIDNVAVGDYSHAEGMSNLANGFASHVEGTRNRTNNISEHAEGQYNVSHSSDPMEFGGGCNTIHSIGIGTHYNSTKNAVEVMQNGDYYLLGVGGYQGTNTKVQDATIKTLQEVISGKQDVLTAGNNIEITSAGTISATNTTYVASDFDIKDLSDTTGLRGAWSNKQDTIDDLDTIRNGATLGATALQSFIETDPTVPDWAKTPNKPTYTAQEVGALPSSTTIPTKTSELINDSGYITGYTLPIASTSGLGGVKIGNGLEIDSTGVVNVVGKQDTLTAGEGIEISGNTISATPTDDATNDDIDSMFVPKIKEIKLIREQANDANYIDWLVNTSGETMEYNGQTYYKWVSWANDGYNNGSWTLEEYPNIIVLTNTLDVQLPFNTNSPEFEYWINIDVEPAWENNYIKGDYTQKTFQ